MAGLVPAIHVLFQQPEGVDARHVKHAAGLAFGQTRWAGHDDYCLAAARRACHCSRVWPQRSQVSLIGAGR